MEAALTGTSGMLAMYYLLCGICVFRLPVIGSCFCRRGVGPRSDAGHHFFGPFALRFCFLDNFNPQTIKFVEKPKQQKNNSSDCWRLGVHIWSMRRINLPISAWITFFGFVFRFQTLRLDTPLRPRLGQDRLRCHCVPADLSLIVCCPVMLLMVSQLKYYIFPFIPLLPLFPFFVPLSYTSRGLNMSRVP